MKWPPPLGFEAGTTRWFLPPFCHLLMPAWQNSGFWNRPDSDREMDRSASSNSTSSQGMANGPSWFENPYSSSAWTSRLLKTGWFRYVARTTNLLELLPTQTATCPAGTSDSVGWADMRALWLYNGKVSKVSRVKPDDYQPLSPAFAAYSTAVICLHAAC